MIRLDALSMLQIVFLFVTFAGVFAIRAKIRKFHRNCIYNLLRKQHTRVLNYSKRLTVKDCTSFERYGIWRYFRRIKKDDVLYKLSQKKERAYEHHFSDIKQFIKISLSN